MESYQQAHLSSFITEFAGLAVVPFEHLIFFCCWTSVACTTEEHKHGGPILGSVNLHGTF